MVGKTCTFPLKTRWWKMRTRLFNTRWWKMRTCRYQFIYVRCLLKSNSRWSKRTMSCISL